MTRHGLGNPEVKRRAQNAQRLTAQQRRQLPQFLLNEGRFMPSVRVSAEWGLAQQTVNAYRRRFGVPLSLDEARSSQDYKLNQQNRGHAFSEQLHRRWAEWRVTREKRLHALKAALQRSPNPPPARSCCACGEQWFATKIFSMLRANAVGIPSVCLTFAGCADPRSVATRRALRAINEYYRIAA